MSPHTRRLSKTIAHALRHEPWLYELELDGEGWTELDELVTGLRGQGPEWASLQRSDIEQVLHTADTRRFEIQGSRIRALYGHSTPSRLLKQPAPPPALLYHGTSPQAAESILATGLRPMNRQYVHLSIDRRTARLIGRRKAPSPAILQIMAAEAHAAGIGFYVGNERVWLADAIPALFIRPTSGAT